MSGNQDLSQEGKKALTVDSNPESDPNEPGSDEIIELTDVVGEGKDPLEADSAKEAATPGLAESAEMKEAFPGDEFSPLESSDFKFEDSSAFEAADADPFPVQSQENLDNVLAGLEKDASAFERPEDILADLGKDELEAEEPQIEQAEEFPSGYEEPADDEKPMDVPAGPAVVPSAALAESAPDENDEAAVTHDIPGISEERMKELLTEVIQETVDKAVRETVSEVAEKVIQEAIDALKQSIASSDT